MEKFKCVICGKEFEGFGNNPSPIKEEGRCCDSCNMLVIRERTIELQLNKLEGDITRKITSEIIAANRESGLAGIHEVLEKYNLVDLLMDTVDKFREMIKNSWTYARLTVAEADRWESMLNSNMLANALKYNEDHKWAILQAVYHSFLEGCGYDGPDWRNPDEK